MFLPLLQTKLYIPVTWQKVVARPAITAKLHAGILHPITLIAAPAGLGKTTLVSEWATQTTEAVAWLSVDDDDNEPTRFPWRFSVAWYWHAFNRRAAIGRTYGHC